MLCIKRSDRHSRKFEKDPKNSAGLYLAVPNPEPGAHLGRTRDQSQGSLRQHGAYSAELRVVLNTQIKRNVMHMSCTCHGSLSSAQKDACVHVAASLFTTGFCLFLFIYLDVKSVYFENQ